MAEQNYRRFEVSFTLYLDTRRFSDPRDWDFNDMFGLNSVIHNGAKIVAVQVKEIPVRPPQGS